MQELSQDERRPYPSRDGGITMEDIPGRRAI